MATWEKHFSNIWKKDQANHAFPTGITVTTMRNSKAAGLGGIYRAFTKKILHLHKIQKANAVYLEFMPTSVNRYTLKVVFQTTSVRVIVCHSHQLPLILKMATPQQKS
jgi:hypothetical protein